MKHSLQFLAVLVMVLVAGFSPRPGVAAPSVGYSGTASTQRILNDIIRGTPGIQTVTTTGGGVVVSGSGTTPVAAGRGVTIPIPTTASAGVSAGRIAGIVAKGIRFGGWVGVAGVVLPWLAEQSGIKTCPPPDFFCKPGPDVAEMPTEGGWYARDRSTIRGGTAEAVCARIWNEMLTQSTRDAQQGYTTWVRTSDAQCLSQKNPSFVLGYVSWRAPTCPSGSRLVGKDCLKSGPDVPATEPDLGNALEKGIQAKPERGLKAFNAIRATGMPVFGPDDPVTVTVPPSVTAPDRVTTATQPKPDGSIDTVKTVVQTEVKPQVSGNTLGNTTVTYPTTTTTTTTTTNNVTNISHTTTTITNVINNPAPNAPEVSPDAPPVIDYPNDETSPEPEKLEIPTDYNREVTQKSILETLKEFVAPVTEALPTGEAETGSIQAANDQAMQGVTDISESSLGLTSWFPSIPTAQCVNPQVTTPITGDMVTVPICDAVNVFSQIVSGVLCFFCIVGCVAQVRAAQQA